MASGCSNIAFLSDFSALCRQRASRNYFGVMTIHRQWWSCQWARPELESTHLCYIQLINTVTMEHPTERSFEFFMSSGRRQLEEQVWCDKMLPAGPVDVVQRHLYAPSTSSRDQDSDDTCLLVTSTTSDGWKHDGTYRQSTQTTEYRMQASVHQKKPDIALNRLLIGFIPEPSHRCPEWPEKHMLIRWTRIYHPRMIVRPIPVYQA